MAHEIYENDSLMLVRQPAWHGLGNVIEDAPTSDEAIKQAGLNWDVTACPVYVNNKAVPDHFANVRSDTKEVLGMVTGRYKIVQNREAFAFTDSLVGGGEVKYETAGSLKNGRMIWMLARLNQDYKILGDEVTPYMCFVNSHDGSAAVRVLMTPVRVVCQNTLNIAIKSATRSWSTKHTGDISAKLKEADDTLKHANKYLLDLSAEADKLAQIAITEKKLAELLHHMIPMPTGNAATNRAVTNIKQKHDAIIAAYAADDIKQFRGTAWGVVNAISDFVGHAEAQRSSDKFDEGRFSKVITGDPLFDAIYKAIKKAA